MGYRIGLAAAVLAASTGLSAQQPQNPPAQATKAPAPAAQKAAPQQAFEIYRISLVPSGIAYALNKPVLKKDVYVFMAWPERTTVHLPKVRVGKITRQTSDLNQEVVYQVDMIPTGHMVTHEAPVLKENHYLFRTFKDGKLVSIKASEVSRVVRLTGIAAFRAKQEAMGATMIGDVPMEGGSAQFIISTPADAPVGSPPRRAPAPEQPPGNWIYEGVPGVTDAYAPAEAVVASPGDVPMAPTPRPRPH